MSATEQNGAGASVSGSGAPGPGALGPSAASATADSLAPKILKAVWMSIVLGLLVQALVMLALSAFPKHPWAEAAQKVSWSVVVCSALAIGNVLSKARPTVVGLVGLLAAPAAFHAARTVQKSLAQGFSGGSVESVPTVGELAMAKAIQYLAFGYCIALATKKGSLSRHLVVGTTAGVAMGGYLWSRQMLGNEPAPAFATVLPKVVNEVAFPIGCSFVLWATTTVGKRLAPVITDAAASGPATPPPPPASPPSPPKAPAG